MDFFRKMVSGDKRRYVTDRYNLDLTYITDRVIAMAFPATGMEAAYRNDGNQVANLFKEKHPGHFCIYNLTERKYDTTMFEGRVHDCGWHDHHAPPIAQLFEIVDHIHNFLLKDRDNVVSIHCLAGKGRTGTVIVSYLLYSGLFHDPDEAALFFALRRSNNNWGVTGPSQQRYIRYFWEILRMKRAPNLSTPLQLTAIKMTGPAKFTVGSKRSFTPIITATDVSGGLIQQPIWSNKGDRTFTDDNEPIVFNLVSGPDAPSTPVLLFGDINFTLDTWGAFGRKTKFARFAFHTGMIINEHDDEVSEYSALSMDRNGALAPSSSSSGANQNQSLPNSDRIVLRFPKIELDDACSDKRTPDGFVLELVLQKIHTQSWMAASNFLASPDPAFWNRLFSEYRDTNGVACFNPRQDMSFVQIIAAARALTDARSGEPPKMGGWLTKRGHRVKNWKKRWFALHTSTLEYSKTPKSTTPAGIIQLDDIVAVQEAPPGDCEYANAFVIYTNWDDFLCYAQNEGDMEEWINTLNLTLQIREQKRELSDATIGQLFVSVLEITNVPTDEYYAVVQLGNQQAKAASTNSFGKELVFDVHQRTSDTMVIQLWEENTYLPDALIGEIQVVLDMFQSQPTKPMELVQMYSFRHQITRVKLKMNYRPKALIEAQRAPAASSSRTGGMVPVALSTSNTSRQANSPIRSNTLSSKVVTPSELKELIEILDFGLMESLRAPDMDHPGTDPVWDWTVSSSLTGVTQPSIPRENRYSAMPHFIDQSLPIFMRPISLDIGLPPSNFVPIDYTTDVPVNTIDSQAITLSQFSTMDSEAASEPTTSYPEPSTSPRPYDIDPTSLKRELAVRAVSPPRSAPALEVSATHRLSALDASATSASTFIATPPTTPAITPLDLRAASVAQGANLMATLSSTSEGTKTPGSPKSDSAHSPKSNEAKDDAPSPRLGGGNWKPATSPSSSRARSPSASPPKSDASPTLTSAASGNTSPNSAATSQTSTQGSASLLQPSSATGTTNLPDFSFTTTTSMASTPTNNNVATTNSAPSEEAFLRSKSFSNVASPDGSWLSPIAPSEDALVDYMQGTTGKTKEIQLIGNSARERRRNRRPTVDAQHPPEYKGLAINREAQPSATTIDPVVRTEPSLVPPIALSENSQISSASTSVPAPSASNPTMTVTNDLLAAIEPISTSTETSESSQQE